MEKREKIIVIVAVIAAIYGVIDFTLTSQKQGAANSSSTRPEGQLPADLPAQLNALSSKGDQKLDRLAASINDPWQGKVFAANRPEFGKEEKVDQTKAAALNYLRDLTKQWVYSGFLSMGTERIAIINGLDYQVGEVINGLAITKIGQDSVQVKASDQDAVIDIPAIIEQAPAAADKKGSNPDHN